MYKRKTRDVWELQANYGYGDGWEYVLEEDTLREAKEQLATYKKNVTYPVRIVKKRVKIES